MFCLERPLMEERAMEVSGRAVIVTGGSSGIGLATAALLARNGAKVVLAARDAENVKRAAESIPGSLGVPTDITREDSIANLVAETLKEFGRIDILINNAGQAPQGRGRIEDCSMKEAKQNADVNFFGQIMMMQAVIPTMREQGGGAIVNVGSGTVKMTIPGGGVYSSLKAALHQISMTARVELADDNIVVAVVHPHITATNFGRNRLVSPPERLERESGPDMSMADPPEKVAKVILDIIRSGEAETVMVPIQG
jgi:NADP-dependent 3-hydroxy acid dehydrogenase YdfG